MRALFALTVLAFGLVVGAAFLLRAYNDDLLTTMNERNPAQLYQDGEKLKHAEKYEQALVKYKMLLNLEWEPARSNFLVGDTLMRMNKPEEAIPYLEEAIRRDPQQSAAYGWLMDAYERLKRYDDLERTAHRLLETGIHPVRAYQSLTLLASLEGDAEKTAAYALQAVAAEPKMPAYRYEALSQLCMNVNATTASLAILEAGLKQHPDNALLIRKLGPHLRAGGQMQKYIAILKRALTANPVDEEMQRNLVLAYRDIGDTTAQLEALERMHTYLPKSAWCLYLRGDMALQQGRPLLAAGLLSRAVVQTADEELQARAFRALGAALVEAGQFSKAVQAYERALVLAPQSLDELQPTIAAVRAIPTYTPTPLGTRAAWPTPRPGETPDPELIMAQEPEKEQEWERMLVGEVNTLRAQLASAAAGRPLSATAIRAVRAATADELLVPTRSVAPVYWAVGVAAGLIALVVAWAVYRAVARPPG